MRWSWLLGAAALAGYLLARRHRLGKPALAAGALATIAAVVIGTGVVQLPNLEQLLEDVGTALGEWTYLAVGVLAFLETGAFVGLLVPGETTVIVGGLVAGQGQISLLVLIAIVWSCAVAGDTTSYFLGRKLGRAWLVRHGERVKITEERLQTVERFFERHGGATILIGRFVGLARALAPFIAGASKMPFRTFLPYDVVGAGAWGATFSVLGYVFWQSFDQLTRYVSRGLFAFGTVIAVGVGLYFLVQLRRDPERRERVSEWLREREDRPVLGRLMRLAGPAWRRIGSPAAGGVDKTARFGAERFTPGALGLELTTLVALAAVGGFGFFLLAEVVTAPGEPPIDATGLDAGEPLRFEPLIGIAKIATDLGSLPVTAALAALTAVWALRRRRRIEAAALVAGAGLSYAAVHIAKDSFDRPRPAASLVDTMLSAFPSGHALYAVTLIACATVLVRAGAGWAARFAAVTVAVAAAAFVAATRVYLRAHYVTDVLAGAALGLAVWALVGVLALFAGALRHNVGRS